MIDAYRLAQLDRSKPLIARLGPVRPATCVINGCPIDEHAWVVTLPDRAGVACLTCAGDRGFAIK